LGFGNCQKNGLSSIESTAFEEFPGTLGGIFGHRVLSFYLIKIARMFARINPPRHTQIRLGELASIARYMPMEVNVIKANAIK